MFRDAALVLAVCGSAAVGGCVRAAAQPDAAMIAQQYGLPGAVANTVATSAGPLQGTLVPVTMADGRQAQLFVPLHQSPDVEAVYLRDDQGLHPVRLTGQTTREQMVQAPSIAVTRPAKQIAARRSWEREVLIVAGATGAGAAIGGLSAGKKGAGIGAAAGGVGGLVYDLITRRKD
jgi:hypothetical protein